MSLSLQCHEHAFISTNHRKLINKHFKNHIFDYFLGENYQRHKVWNKNKTISELSFFTRMWRASVCDGRSPIFSGPLLCISKKVFVPLLWPHEKFWPPQGCPLTQTMEGAVIRLKMECHRG